MFVKAVSAKQGRSLLAFLMLCGLLGLFLAFPQALANGIRRGLSICSSVIIPTLYPFMMVSGFLADYSVHRTPSRWTAFLMRRVFGLPSCCALPVLLSFAGGYPSGAIAIRRLQKQHRISSEEAQRMTLFCVNAGPGFIVGTVGAGLLGSQKAGLLLFASHLTASLLIGVFSGIGHRHDRPSIWNGNGEVYEVRSPAVIVSDTCGSLMTVCGFVLLTTAGLSLWESTGMSLLIQRAVGIPSWVSQGAIAGFSEVGCGCIALSAVGDSAPFFLSLCLGWGGLSVHGQISAILSQKGLLNSRFFLCRVLHGLLSGWIAVCLFRWIPADLPTLSSLATAKTVSFSAEASVMLLLLSFLAMVCFSQKKTGNSSDNVI